MMEEEVVVFQRLQLVILANLAREEMTECEHSGGMGVCPTISETMSRDTEMEVE